MASSTLFEILVVLFGRIPLLVILVIGLGMALRRHRQAPRAMRLIAAGCGLALLNVIASQAIFTILPMTVGGSSFPSFYRLISLAFGILGAVSSGLILLGAFADRGDEPRGFSVIFDSQTQR